jgi:hypothetical protein
VSAHVGLRAEVVTIRGGGEKVVIRDVEGMVMEVVILGPETGPRGRDHKNVRLLFKAPFSRPKAGRALGRSGRDRRRYRTCVVGRMAFGRQGAYPSALNRPRLGEPHTCRALGAVWTVILQAHAERRVQMAASRTLSAAWSGTRLGSGMVGRFRPLQRYDEMLRKSSPRT